MIWPSVYEFQSFNDILLIKSRNIDQYPENILDVFIFGARARNWTIEKTVDLHHIFQFYWVEIKYCVYKYC